MTNEIPESVLTPNHARSLVCIMTARTGTPVFDDDLVQDALLRGVQAFRRTRDVKYPQAFFAKIVKDAVRDYWRQQQRFIPLESIDEQKLAYVSDLENKLDRADRLHRIITSFDLLSPGERELMHLFYFEESSISQLTVTLAKSRSAIKMALLRSRNRVISIVMKNAI